MKVEKKQEGMRAYLRKQIFRFEEWMKPDPADSKLVQIGKTILKSIVFLVLIALSPILLIIFAFVFFAAIWNISMHVLKSPLFVLCCLLFLAHQFMQKVLHINIWVLDSYLDNLLAMPVILTLFLAERTFLFPSRTPSLNKSEVIVIILYVSVIAELLFPLLSERFTADLLDVLFYCIGSIIFLVWINPKRPAVSRWCKEPTLCLYLSCSAIPRSA